MLERYDSFQDLIPSSSLKHLSLCTVWDAKGQQGSFNSLYARSGRELRNRGIRWRKSALPHAFSRQRECGLAGTIHFFLACLRMRYLESTHGRLP